MCRCFVLKTGNMVSGKMAVSFVQEERLKVLLLGIMKNAVF